MFLLFTDVVVVVIVVVLCLVTSVLLSVAEFTNKQFWIRTWTTSIYWSLSDHNLMNYVTTVQFTYILFNNLYNILKQNCILCSLSLTNN